MHGDAGADQGIAGQAVSALACEQAAEEAVEARTRAHEREVQRLAREGAQQRSFLQARVAELQVCACGPPACSCLMGECSCV